MKFASICRKLISKRFPPRVSASPLDGLELSRIVKISKGLTDTYRLPKGKFFRHILYSTIYRTIKEHHRLFDDLEPITLQWAEKKALNGKKVIYMEHGWLPRSTYQLSSRGCNSRSHVKFDCRTDYIKMLGGNERLQRLKNNLRMSEDRAGNFETRLVDRPFILVALQTGNDFNLLYSNTPFADYYGQDFATAKLGQALIEHVESIPTGTRVIFTQHPEDRDKRPFKVAPENRMVYAGNGVRTIDLLRHMNCRGVVSINSNILHEALLWDKPALAIGELLVSKTMESPFPGELEAFMDDNTPEKYRSTLCDQYLAMLFAYQWTLTDFQNPIILREILKDVDALVPWTVRMEYGYNS